MEWFRMYAEFATDPKVQSMSEPMQRRLLMLMCLRCSNVLVTLQVTDICFALRITEEELTETKALFIRKNFITEDFEFVHWDKRQKSSDSSAPRVRAFRERQKALSETVSNVTVTPQKRIEEKREEESKPKSKADARATRLPADWEPSEIDLSFCKSERPDLNPKNVESQFRDYWLAQPGAKGRKADWPATWRNWVRNQRATYGPSVVRSSYHDERAATIAGLTGRSRANERDDRTIDVPATPIERLAS